MEILDAERMRAADSHAIDVVGVPSLVLMDNAGRGVAETMDDRIDGLADRRVWIVCGTGNNGGDGFVTARWLAHRGVAVEVVLVGARVKQLKGDAATMARAWTGVGGTTIEVPDERAWDELAPGILGEDVVVDALFGTGLTRPLDGLAATVVESINTAEAIGAIVVAVDLPSGLFAGQATIPGPAVRADMTVTFQRPKLAHMLAPAEDLCGVVTVVDIGIPDASIDAAGCDLHWVTADDAAALVPERDPEDHKGRFGHVLVVAGSVGKAGAAALTGRGALRAGAGLVTIAVPAPVRAEVALFGAEAMTEALPACAAGRLADGAAATTLALCDHRNVVALGPGIGATPEVAAEVRRIVRESTLPIVLDADGVNAYAGAAEELKQRTAPLVLTPHPGEAARLMGADRDAIQADRVGWARRIATATGAVCLLKGYRTVVAGPDGQAFVNPTGNPGMATGGMGDALTGIVAGLLAQGLDPLDAALLAAYLHGAAGDLAVETGRQTVHTLMAGDVLDHLALAIATLEGRDHDDGDDA